MQSEVVLGRYNRPGGQHQLIELIEGESQILNPPAMEGHVVPADATGDFPLMFAGQGQHIVVHVDADDPPLRADNLRSDVADFAAPRAKVEHDLPFAHKARRIAAAVIPLDQLGGEDRQVFLIVAHRATKGGHDGFRGGGVAAQDGGF